MKKAAVPKFDSKLKKRANALAPLFTVDVPHKLSVRTDVDSYIAGLMVMSRIIVHATIVGVTPQFTLTDTSLKITIGDARHQLTDADITLAEQIVTVLSTDRRPRR